MDSGVTVKPMVGVALAGYVRPDPAAMREAVATDLAASQSVTAAAETTPSSREMARPLPVEPAFAHDVIIDPATREVIYRLVDVRSGQVVNQVPDQMQLQIAAYNQAVERAIAHGRTLTEAEAKADLDVAI